MPAKAVGNHWRPRTRRNAPMKRAVATPVVTFLFRNGCVNRSPSDSVTLRGV